MTSFDLTEDENTVLRETLESYISDLRLEVSATDNKELRDELKLKEKTLKGVMAKLQELQKIAVPA